MASEDGASPEEQLFEACRRDNESLLDEILKLFPTPEAVAKFLNTTTDPRSASALHVAAQNGAYSVLDLILDQEGVEIDGQEPHERDTCLHKAVRYCNGFAPGESERGIAVVEMLVDAGCDPRIRNKAKFRPFDLVDPKNVQLRELLQKAEFEIIMSNDAVVEDEDDQVDGPGSESD